MVARKKLSATTRKLQRRQKRISAGWKAFRQRGRGTNYFNKRFLNLPAPLKAEVLQELFRGTWKDSSEWQKEQYLRLAKLEADIPNPGDKADARAWLKMLRKLSAKGQQKKQVKQIHAAGAGVIPAGPGRGKV